MNETQSARDDARLDMILEEVRHIRQLVEAQNGRVRTNSENIARLQTKATMTASLQAVFTMLLSSLAAYMGVRH